MKTKIKRTQLFRPNIPQKISNLSWPQAKARFPLMRPLGDADGDKLKNKFDCKPFDRKRQGKKHDKEREDLFMEDWGYSREEAKEHIHNVEE